MSKELRIDHDKVRRLALFGDVLALESLVSTIVELGIDPKKGRALKPRKGDTAPGTVNVRAINEWAKSAPNDPLVLGVAATLAERLPGAFDKKDD